MTYGARRQRAEGAAAGGGDAMLNTRPPDPAEDSLPVLGLAACAMVPAVPPVAEGGTAVTDTSTATGAGRTGITRPVLLAGIVLGTCLTILVMWNGVRLRVPDLPSIIGAALGALILWVLFMAVAAVLSELTVRHHRAAIRYGWRHTRRGGAAAAGWSRRAARGAAVRSGPWRTRIITVMRTRWAARGAPAPLEPEDPAGNVTGGNCPGCGWPLPAAGSCPTCGASAGSRPAGPGHRPDLLVGPRGQPVPLACRRPRRTAIGGRST